MVTFLFYYPAVILATTGTLKRGVPVCITASAGTRGASLGALWQFLPKSTSFRKKLYSPMGHPAISQVFPPIQFWLPKVQTVSGGEKDYLLHQVLSNGRTQVSTPTSQWQNHIHYTKELGTMLQNDSLEYCLVFTWQPVSPEIKIP